MMHNTHNVYFICVTMFLKLLLCILLGAAAPGIEADVIFPKCCYSDDSLVKVTDEFLNVSLFCVDREFAKTNYSREVPPLITGEDVVIQYGYPENCTLIMTDFNYDDYIPENHCVDRIIAEVVNDTQLNTVPKIVALTCSTEQNHSLTAVSLNQIRKCCPKGQSYDVEYHVCRRAGRENNEKWLISQLDSTEDYTYEVSYDVHCKPNEFALELTENLYDFELHGSTMKVRQSGYSKVLKTFLRGEWCADQAYGRDGLVLRGCSQDCTEFGAFCLRKCCPIGQHFQPVRCGTEVSVCVPSIDDATSFNVSYYVDPVKRDSNAIGDVFGIKTSLVCKQGKFVLHHENPDDAHHLALSGEMVVPIMFGGPTMDYCIEIFDKRNCTQEVTVQALICYQELYQQKDFSVSFVANSISCVFLFLTLVVYCALPELRNLHGRTLICHVSTMLLAYCCLARVQYDNVANPAVCKLLGYGIYFGFVSAFSWLNVMCLDIWWTFGSIRTIQPMRKADAERRRFLWYSFYAWGVSVALTITMLMLDLYPVTQVLNAHIGRDICWFGSIQNTITDWPHYIFFVIPMGLVTCVDFVLWVLTARHCHRVKSEVHRLQAGSVGDRAKKRFRADKARYVLTGKLWVVMGAGWVWELLSTIVSEPRWFWAIFDLINELQGVSIFLILVLKPKLYYLIRKKLGLEKPELRKNGTSSTGRTSSTFLSRTISSDEKAQQRVSMANTNKIQ